MPATPQPNVSKCRCVLNRDFRGLFQQIQVTLFPESFPVYTTETHKLFSDYFRHYLFFEHCSLAEIYHTLKERAVNKVCDSVLCTLEKANY